MGAPDPFPRLSDLGRCLGGPSGIHELMQDLGDGLSGDDVAMMGGGNPAHIPEVEALWRRRLHEILETPGEMERMLGDYDAPGGDPTFLEAIAAFFNDLYGWGITPENVAVTGGSQNAYFLLFNLLAGPSQGRVRQILFPIVPEYVGYADQALHPSQLAARRPIIEPIGARGFKYRVDLERLDPGPETAALCLSRPTNPTANIVTAAELRHLLDLARERDLLLLLDHAYGEPFPGVAFAEATPFWDERVILSFSLSKLGLPATRTGIVIARPDIIRHLKAANAVLNLANCSVGQRIVLPLLRSGELTRLCRDVVRPFYHARARRAQHWIEQAIPEDVSYRIHVPEGAFFLWLWFPGLPAGDRELYLRLKRRGALVVPGSHFFPGLTEPWEHRHHCIRLSYCIDERRLQRGIGLLAEEVARAYRIPAAGVGSSRTTTS